MDSLKRIESEFEDFRNEILSLSKEKIFDEAYKIRFYKEIYSFIKETHYKLKKSTSIAGLYDFYLNDQYRSITTWSEVRGLIYDYEHED